MKITPLGERVLLKQKKEEKTAKGIYIPESVKDEKKQGIVVSIGSGLTEKNTGIKPGDSVLYGGYSSEEFEIDGDKHIIIEYKDIVAKIE
jgi:chaperonin GroES